MTDRTIIEPDKSNRTINFGLPYSLYRQVRLLSAKLDISMGATCRRLIEAAMKAKLLK